MKKALSSQKSIQVVLGMGRIEKGTLIFEVNQHKISSVEQFNKDRADRALLIGAD